MIHSENRVNVRAKALALGALLGAAGLSASAPAADETVLSSFCQNSADPSGTLYYGKTNGGGANSSGTIFKIATDGSNYAVFYSFCSLASCACRYERR